MLRFWKLFLVVSFVLPFVSTAANAQTTDDEFRSIVNELHQRSFTKKKSVIEKIVDSAHPKYGEVLNLLLEGELYYLKSNKAVFRVEKGEDLYKLYDLLSGELAQEVEQFDVKKVSINNKLRGVLKTRLATVNLRSADTEARKNAVREIINNLSPDAVALIKELEANETDSAVQELMQIAISLGEISPKSEQAVRIAAIEKMAESLSPEIKNRLTPLLEDDDPVVVKAVRDALDSINTRIKYYAFLENLFFGLSLGSVLLLAAIGLAITFGVMGVINMAHGELIMIGAYVTYVVQLIMPNYIEYSLFVAIPAAFLITALIGILIERGVIRFLYGRPLETLLATFGISLVLQQLARTIFSPLNRAVETPEWMSGSLMINSAFSMTYNRLYIIIFSLIVFALLLLILKKTSLGLQVRAVSQNRAMARAMGVRSGWVDAMTFGLGSGIAGVAGVALSQLTNVGPNMGQAYIIDSFMVVVFGGVGNLWGTLVGAMSLGVVNKFLEPWSGAVLAKILVLVAIILFIQKRPRGLFPQKGRAAEN